MRTVSVEVRYTRHITLEYRRRLNLWYGRPGLASVHQVRDHLRYCGAAVDADIWDKTEEAYAAEAGQAVAG